MNLGEFLTDCVRWLGEQDAKDKLMGCVERVCGSGVVTKDLGGTATTKEVTKAVCEEIDKLA